MSIVSIRKVDHYDKGLLDAAVAAHFDALGVERDIRPDMRVVLKPNLLTGRRPDTAVTTHPALLRAVAEWFRARGVTDIILADSPGGPYKTPALAAVYKACGLEQLRDVLTLNTNVSSRATDAAPGSSVKAFQIIEPLLTADYIVNIAKMKTHGMMTTSLGAKNLFGAVPGLLKPRLHYDNPSVEGFARMLVSLARTIKPQITLIDGVLAMEGNGPGGGIPRNMGVLMASRDLFDQDYLACQLMGIEPESTPLVAASIAQGLCNPATIERIGDLVPPADPPFKMPDARRLDFTSHTPNWMRAPLARFFDSHMRAIPIVRAELCGGCGKCAESCPQHIIRIEDRKAVIAKKGCISCFCCQEMCPVKAIDAERKYRWRKEKDA